MVRYLNIYILIASVVIWTKPTITYRLRSGPQNNGTKPTPRHVYVYDRSQRLLDEPHHLCRKPGRQCLDEHKLHICTGLLRPKILIHCNLKGNGRPYCNNVEQECSSERSLKTDDEFTCPGAGFYPDPYDCQAYYECNKIDGIGFLYSCPDLNVFDFDQQICQPTHDLKKPCRIIDCRRKWRKLIRYQNTTSLYSYCDPNSIKIRLFECHREPRPGSKCIFNSTTDEFELRPTILATLNLSSSTILTHKQMKKLNKINKHNKTLPQIFNYNQFPIENQIERYNFDELDNNDNHFNMSTINESTESLREEEIVESHAKSDSKYVNWGNKFNHKLGSDISRNESKYTRLSGSGGRKTEFIANTDEHSERISNSYGKNGENSEISQNDKLSSITDLTVNSNDTKSSLKSSPEFIYVNSDKISLDIKILNEKGFITETRRTAEKDIRILTDNIKLNLTAYEMKENNSTSITQNINLSNATIFLNDSIQKAYSSFYNVTSEEPPTILDDESKYIPIAPVGFDNISSTTIYESSSATLDDNYKQFTKTVYEAHRKAMQYPTVTEKMKSDAFSADFNTESYLSASLKVNTTDSSNWKEATLTSQKTSKNNVLISSQIQEHSTKTDAIKEYTNVAPSMTKEQLLATVVNDHTSGYTTAITEQFFTSDKIHLNSTSGQSSKTTSDTIGNINNTKSLLLTHNSGISDSVEHTKNILEFEKPLTSVKMVEPTTFTSLDDQKHSSTNEKSHKIIIPIHPQDKSVAAIVKKSDQLNSSDQLRVTDDEKQLSAGAETQDITTPLQPTNSMEKVSITMEMSDYHNLELTGVEEELSAKANNQGSITVLPIDIQGQFSSTVEMMDYRTSKLTDIQNNSPTNVKRKNDVTVLHTGTENLMTVKISGNHTPKPTDFEEQSSTTIQNQYYVILPFDTDEQSSTTVKLNNYQTSGFTNVAEQSTYINNQVYVTTKPIETKEQSTTAKIPDLSLPSQVVTSELTDVEKRLTTEKLTSLKNTVEEQMSTRQEITDYTTFTEVLGGETKVTVDMTDTMTPEVHHAIDNKSNNETNLGQQSGNSQYVDTLNSSNYYNLYENKTYISSSLNKPESLNSVILSEVKEISASSGCIGLIHISGTFRNFDPHFVII